MLEGKDRVEIHEKIKDKVKHGKAIKVALIIGVMIIPLLYSLFYLGAFWDPYASMDHVPIAIVNQDQGAQVFGKDRNVGFEIADKMKDSKEFDFEFTDYNVAVKGVEGDKYYAMIVIPSDFSEDIATASTTEKIKANVYCKVNDKKNYLGDQIIENAIKRMEGMLNLGVSSQIVGNLSDKLELVPESLDQMTAGLDELESGADKIDAGATKLSSNMNLYVSKTSTYAYYMGQLSNKTSKLGSMAKNVNDINVGMQQLNTGVKNYTTGVSSIVGTTANPNSGSLVQAMYLLQSGYNAGYFDSNPTLKIQVGTMLQAYGSAQSQQSLTALRQGSDNLPANSAALTGYMNQLNTATASLPELTASINTLAANANALNDGADKLATGSSELSGATSKMSGGVSEMNSQVSEKSAEAKDETAALDGMDSYAEEPITISNEKMFSVPNYGTAFAPYFLSLSLWVGGLIIFFGIYFDADSRIKILSVKSDRPYLRSFLILFIGMAQSVIIAGIIQWVLGLHVENIFMYVWSSCLVSLVFVSIIQFFILHLGDIGKFLAICCLILQLASCGGTFPMETVPEFFNVMYPWMPMTYSVNLFREAIMGTTDGNVARNALILLAIFVVALGLTFAMSQFKKKARETLLGENEPA